MINLKVIKGEPRRDVRVHRNAATWIVPYLKIQDPVGGSAVFYDSKVKLIKA
jgi:hypothetical protein